ncbi:hypothetical protein DFO70_1482 [Cytobacillus firmus]|uniref:Uncharacterized protein n=2 Tax=Cytobacillus TaxID=2675230 RepID=A0A366JEV5_CYTFI|nr:MULTISPECIES: hypothetical protein [Cytobacillus]RBP84939.1 hypothetical protein DFO70_1482 [Cytobacillus firmus]TDX36359.1 hypothetical protein DFO72_12118 [Cytobacillus oceanisediminis]
MTKRLDEVFIAGSVCEDSLEQVVYKLKNKCDANRRGGNLHVQVI